MPRDLASFIAWKLQQQYSVRLNSRACPIALRVRDRHQKHGNS